MSHHYLQFTDVHYRYPGSNADALKGVSFRIVHGERVALLGLNGSGKSTLLLHTNGLCIPDSGSVNVGGIPVTKKTAPLVRQTVGMVFQNADDQLFMPTVEDDVAFGPRNMMLPEEEVERRVSSALEAVGCMELRKHSSQELSGGQRRAVAIATVLSMEPSILILDEPTANLDRATRRKLIEILNTLTHTVVIATHDLELALEFCNRAIFMDSGHITADGQVYDILTDHPLMERTGMDIPSWVGIYKPTLIS